MNQKLGKLNWTKSGNRHRTVVPVCMTSPVAAIPAPIEIATTLMVTENSGNIDLEVNFGVDDEENEGKEGAENSEEEENSTENEGEEGVGTKDDDEDYVEDDNNVMTAEIPLPKARRVKLNRTVPVVIIGGINILQPVKVENDVRALYLCEPIFLAVKTKNRSPEPCWEVQIEGIQHLVTNKAGINNILRRNASQYARLSLSPWNCRAIAVLLLFLTSKVFYFQEKNSTS